jgi:DNA-binding NarL/FixJ family response regulator
MIEKRPNHRYAGQILEAFGSGTPCSSSHQTDERNRSRSPLENPALIEPLTNREIEVLRMLAEVSSNKAIGQRLFISPETVKRHLSTIYRKLDVRNRKQAIICAKSYGIL